MSSAADKSRWVGSHRWLLGGIVGGLAVIGLVLGFTMGSSSSNPTGLTSAQTQEIQTAMQRYNAGAAGRRAEARASNAAAALGVDQTRVENDLANVQSDEQAVASGLSSLRNNSSLVREDVSGLATNIQTIRKWLSAEVAAGGTTDNGGFDAEMVQDHTSTFLDNLYGDQTGGFQPAASTVSQLRSAAKQLPKDWRTFIRAEKINDALAKRVPHVLHAISRQPSVRYEQHLLSEVPGAIASAEAVGAAGNRVIAPDLAEAKALLIRGNDAAGLPPLSTWANSMEDARL